MMSKDETRKFIDGELKTCADRLNSKLSTSEVDEYADTHRPDGSIYDPDEMILINRMDAELIAGTMDLRHYPNSGVQADGNLSDLQCALMSFHNILQGHSPITKTMAKTFFNSDQLKAKDKFGKMIAAATIDDALTWLNGIGNYQHGTPVSEMYLMDALELDDEVSDLERVELDNLERRYVKLIQERVKS